MPAVRFTFSLDAIQDVDLVRWLELQPNTSAAVREALRAYVDRPTRGQLESKIDQVLDILRGVQVVQAGAGEAGQEGGEPARARANLDKMKERFRR